MAYKHLFGPILSRRLGRSLGVDFIPAKTCTLDCLYCESGRTTLKTTKRQEFYPLQEIKDELTDYLMRAPELDFITFSGAGEPTLYAPLGGLVAFLKTEFPTYKLALLTNGTLFNQTALWEEMAAIDLIIPSIDAADAATFAKINLPHSHLNVEDILKGIYDFSRIYSGKIWIEVFIISGINSSLSQLQPIKEWIQRIDPDRVQINSLDRPGAYKKAKKPDCDTLLQIKNFLGPKAEIVTRQEKRVDLLTFDHDVEAAILKNVAIRPTTINDLCAILGLEREAVSSYLAILMGEERLCSEWVDNHLFYKLLRK